MDLDACDRDAKMYCIMGMTFLEINIKEKVHGGPNA